MTTRELVDFYYTRTSSIDTLPRKLEGFEVVVGDLGDMVQKVESVCFSSSVIELGDPGQYGRIAVRGHEITTSNVLRLEFDPVLWDVQLSTIDGAELLLENSAHNPSVTITKADGFWYIDSVT